MGGFFSRYGLSRQYEQLKHTVYVRLIWDLVVILRVNLQIFVTVLRGKPRKPKFLFCIYLPATIRLITRNDFVPYMRLVSYSVFN